jgi:tetratricopeptide (TPR) repeat protein
VSKLAEQLRVNPRYANDRNYNQFHHRLLAGIARQQGDDTGAHEQLQRAMSQSRSSELNTMMVTLLAGAGEYDAASEFIDEAMQYAPRNLLRAAAWRRDLQKLRDYVDELERYSDSQERKKE